MRTYGSFEGDQGHTEKVPIQLIGSHDFPFRSMTAPRFLSTYDYLRGAVKIDTAPGVRFIRYLGCPAQKPEEALRVS